MLYPVLQTFLTIGCLLGNYFNCKRIKFCFIIWILCNIGWLYVDFLSCAYSRMVLNAVQIGFNVYGLTLWASKHNDMKGRDVNENEQQSL